MSTPVAIITGASRGIGRATAVELARRGYRLALAARSGAELERTAAACGGAAGDAAAFVADVADPDAVRRLIDATADRFGRIDAVVNNAGVAPALTIERTTIEQWRRIIDTNLSAAFYACKFAWPHLSRRGGAIVNISSLAARDPFPGLGAYGAAKGGLHPLGLALAREGEPHGVRVHTLALGAVETDMFRALVSPDAFPADKALTPEDVAAVIAACVAGDLRYTSGEVIWLHKTA